MLIAQITDMHVSPSARPVEGRVDTEAYLRRAVTALLGVRPQPDLVLLTGDLVELGAREEYRLLRELVTPLAMPLYLIPGNHDNRANLRAEFADHTYLPRDGAFLHYVVDDYPLRLIGLDTVIPGSGAGELCAERLAWLAQQLSKAPRTPTLIFMHHPPMATGIQHMDEVGLGNADALRAIVASNPQIERIVCGHVHRQIHARFAGTLAVICPSSAHQIALDFAPGAPAAFTLEPPAFLLHRWEGGVLTTHTVSINAYLGPYLYQN